MDASKRRLIRTRDLLDVSDSLLLQCEISLSHPPLCEKTAAFQATPDAPR
jgi:hypothetical protein